MSTALPVPILIDERDHVKGPDTAPVTLIAYCDFECPYSGQTYPVLQSLLTKLADHIRYIYRHFPLLHKHPHSQQAAEAAEAAGAQHRFWEMCDLLFTHQAALDESDLLGYARLLGLNGALFEAALHQRTYAKRVYRDIAGGRRHGITGTPAFFLNGIKIGDEGDLAGLVLKAVGDIRSGGS